MSANSKEGEECCGVLAILGGLVGACFLGSLLVKTFGFAFVLKVTSGAFALLAGLFWLDVQKEKNQHKKIALAKQQQEKDRLGAKKETERTDSYQTSRSNLLDYLSEIKQNILKLPESQNRGDRFLMIDQSITALMQDKGINNQDFFNETKSKDLNEAIVHDFDWIIEQLSSERTHKAALDLVLPKLKSLRNKFSEEKKTPPPLPKS